MVTKEDKWVRIFDIPDVSRHKKGFTIYKVISMLYPESCPDAITKITVWKRYNDCKKLHREMKSMHHSLKIKEKFPSLPSATFFNRFDDEIIQQRRQMILNFLEFVSAHSQLFTSNSFVKFFETSHTPCALLSSSINSIRADLNLPSEPEYLSFHSPDSDDDCTMSDTDSVSTMSSLSSSMQMNDHDPFVKSSQSLTGISRKLSELSLNTSNIPKTINETVVDCLSNNILSGLLWNLEYDKPGDNDSVSVSNVSISVDTALTTTKNVGDPQYIVEAEKYITQGTEFEQNRKFDEAFTSYKQAISILLSNVKGDTNVDRKQAVRYKIEKYLLRAEKIYNVHLSPGTDLVLEMPRPQTNVQRPFSDLYKFKVIKVIGTGMLVIHAESQQLYYVKVIHKTSMFNNHDLVLPTDVPFMIRLHNFYNCENALFLVLEYCSGSMLWDYVRQKSLHTSIKSGVNRNTFDTSDNDSECSFSDLLNDYNSNKHMLSLRPNESVRDDGVKDEIVMPSRARYGVDNVDDILEKSQELLVSVDEALRRNAEMKRANESPVVEDDFEIINVPSQRKYSDTSCNDECDIEEFNEIPLEKAVRWAAQLLLGLENLHNAGVICGDLQSNNIMINEKDDLTLTYMCKTNGKKVFNYKTNNSLAPEVYRFENITPAADWWSYGTILYEMLVGMPIGCTHPEGILSYTMLKIPKFVSAEGRSLLKQLLVYDPHTRLGSGATGTEEIKSHPFFNTIKWHSLSYEPFLGTIAIHFVT